MMDARWYVDQKLREMRDDERAKRETMHLEARMMRRTLREDRRHPHVAPRRASQHLEWSRT